MLIQEKQASTPLHSLLKLAVEIRGEPVTAVPAQRLTQKQVGQQLGITDPVIWKLLNAPHIQTRHLYLPTKKQPSASDRHDLFQMGIKDIGVKAIQGLFQRNNLDPYDVDVLATVTSTALPLPGASAMIMRETACFRSDTQRMDIVGMGCNGGGSGLRALAMSLRQLASIRGRTCLGVLLCCEINSAFCVNKDTIGHGVVNSLFGDGAVALLLEANPSGLEPARCLPPPMQPYFSIEKEEKESYNNCSNKTGIALFDFDSETLPDYFDDMLYRIDQDSQLMHFQLSKRIPFAMGQSAHIPIRRLLARHNIDNPKMVDHWVVHGGGAKVTELLAASLNLDPDTDLRHTKSVLRDFGNLSSGSLFFSLARLHQEEMRLKAGDTTVFVAMGPGATIEVALGIVVCEN